MEILVGLVVLGAVIWFFVSLAGAIYPFRPFITRKRALASAAGVFIATCVISLFYSPIEQGEQSAQFTASSCGDGGLMMRDVVAISGEYELRSQPDPNANRIKNAKATNALGTTRYYRVDSSTTVERLCVQSNWTEVQIVTPDWLTHVRGWVPNEALRDIERTATGRRIFTEDDIYWDDDTVQYKNEILNFVNQTYSDNTRCKTIDAYSIAKSISKSKPDNPVFYVTCNSGASAFNVWFMPYEAERGH